MKTGAIIQPGIRTEESASSCTGGIVFPNSSAIVVR
jgi:hypothetical protein